MVLAIANKSLQSINQSINKENYKVKEEDEIKKIEMSSKFITNFYKQRDICQTKHNKHLKQ